MGDTILKYWHNDLVRPKVAVTDATKVFSPFFLEKMGDTIPVYSTGITTW